MSARTLTSFILLLTLPCISSAQEYRGPIIDVHMHPFGAALNREGTPQPIVCVNDVLDCDNPPSEFITDDAVLSGTFGRSLGFAS